MDLNDDGPAGEWLTLLEAAEANAETDFEIEFCESLREKLDVYGSRARLTGAQEHKLRCIARGGGFWERGT